MRVVGPIQKKSETKIRNAIFDQRSTQPPEVGVSRWRKQTHTHTDGHGDCMTNSAQWGQVGEKNVYFSWYLATQKSN